MHDPAPIDLVLLQTFYEVARTGSVTRAAEKLGRSQPAVSRRLHALEQDLDVKLFEKVGRRLQLTDHGRKLRSQCVNLMAVAQGIREQLAHGSGQAEGRVAVGTLPTIASQLLVPALHGILTKHEKISLVFRFGWVSRLYERLRTGELDILVVIGEVGERDLEVAPVGKVSIAAAMRPGLFPDAQDVVTPDELRTQRYLAFGGERDPTFDLVDRFVARHDLERAHTPRIPHIETLRELAAAGTGYLLVPRYTTHRDEQLGRLVAMPVADLPETLPISMVMRPGRVLTPALETVEHALSLGIAALVNTVS